MLGEGMGSYWRDLGEGEGFCVRVVVLGHGVFWGREIGRGEGRTGRSIVCRSHCWFTYKQSRLVYDYQAEGFVRRGKFTKSPAIDLPKNLSD